MSRVCACVRVCARACACVRVCARVLAHTHTRTEAGKDACAQARECWRACVPAHTHRHTHTGTHTYAHAHAHLHGRTSGVQHAHVWARACLRAGMPQAREAGRKLAAIIGDESVYFQVCAMCLRSPPVRTRSVGHSVGHGHSAQLSSVHVVCVCVCVCVCVYMAETVWHWRREIEVAGRPDTRGRGCRVDRDRCLGSGV